MKSDRPIPLEPQLPWHRRLRRRLWREWCFLRAVGAHLRMRFLLLLALLSIGAFLFIRFEPEKHHTLAQGIYLTWSLIFGQAAEEFPDARILQALFFIVPVLGLGIIIEAIIDFAGVLRDRGRYERSWCLTMAQSLSNHIILVGLGRLGYRTWRILRKLDEPVVVIERNADGPFLDQLRKDGTPFLIGDGRRDELLIEAGVARARSVILATDDDLANMEMALDARRLQPGIRVVLRMFDQALADKIREGFGIRLAMSQSSISAPTFATSALDPSIVNSFMVGNELIVMRRLAVGAGSDLAGKTVTELAQRVGGAVVEHRRGEASRSFPAAETILAAGDELLVQGPFEKMRALATT